MTKYQKYENYLLLCSLHDIRPVDYISFETKYVNQINKKVELYRRYSLQVKKLGYEISKRGSVFTITRKSSTFNTIIDISETDGLSETIRQLQYLINLHK